MKKTRIDVIASTESYHNLSSFDEVEEMNKVVRAYRDNIKSSVKRVDVQDRLIALLEVLKRHSCKYVGVSFLYKRNIAEMMDVSYKTIQRLVKKLEDLSMIKQVPTKSKRKKVNKMLQTSNAIIILPAASIVPIVSSDQLVPYGPFPIYGPHQAEMSNKTPDKSPTKCPTSKTSSSFLKQNLVINNTYFTKSSDPIQSNASSLKPEKHNSPYVQFRDMVANFIDDSKLANKLYGIYLAQTKSIRDSYEPNELLDKAIESLKVTFFATKRKPIRNLAGYFNGTLRKLLDKLYQETMDELFECADKKPTRPFYDFIDAN